MGGRGECGQEIEREVRGSARWSERVRSIVGLALTPAIAVGGFRAGAVNIGRPPRDRKPVDPEVGPEHVSSRRWYAGVVDAVPARMGRLSDWESDRDRCVAEPALSEAAPPARRPSARPSLHAMEAVSVDDPWDELRQVIGEDL